MLTADNLQTGAPALEASYCVASSVERGRLVEGPCGGAGKHVDGRDSVSMLVMIRAAMRPGRRGCCARMSSWVKVGPAGLDGGHQTCIHARVAGVGQPGVGRLRHPPIKLGRVLIHGRRVCSTRAPWVSPEPRGSPRRPHERLLLRWMDGACLGTSLTFLRM
jgi:hypothetical protein